MRGTGKTAEQLDEVLRRVLMRGEQIVFIVPESSVSYTQRLAFYVAGPRLLNDVSRKCMYFEGSEGYLKLVPYSRSYDMARRLENVVIGTKAKIVLDHGVYLDRRTDNFVELWNSK